MPTNFDENLNAFNNPAFNLFLFCFILKLLCYSKKGIKWRTHNSNKTIVHGVYGNNNLHLLEKVLSLEWCWYYCYFSFYCHVIYARKMSLIALQMMTLSLFVMNFTSQVTLSLVGLFLRSQTSTTVWISPCAPQRCCSMNLCMEFFETSFIISILSQKVFSPVPTSAVIVYSIHSL